MTDPGSALPPRVYRNKDLRVWAAIWFGVAGLLELGALIKNLHDPRGVGVVLATIGVIALVCLRMATVRAEGSAAGLLVVNVVSRRRIEWREIERFELVDELGQSWCRAVRPGKADVKIKAVGERRLYCVGEGKALVAEMNEELAHYTGRAVFTGSV